MTRDHDKETFTIEVNGHDVTIEGKHQTGLSIKEAAQAQGAGIDTSFVLSLEKKSGELKVYGDADKITLKPDMEFLAVPDDDNSRGLQISVEAAIDHIRKTHPEANIEVIEDEDGGAHVILDRVPTSDTYVQQDTWIGFHITKACEYADVYPFFVRPDLKRKDGRALGAGFQNKAAPFPNGSRPAIQLSRRTNKSVVPSTRIPTLKLEKVLIWLRNQ